MDKHVHLCVCVCETHLPFNSYIHILPQKHQKQQQKRTDQSLSVIQHTNSHSQASSSTVAPPPPLINLQNQTELSTTTGIIYVWSTEHMKKGVCKFSTYIKAIVEFVLIAWIRDTFHHASCIMLLCVVSIANSSRVHSSTSSSTPRSTPQNQLSIASGTASTSATTAASGGNHSSTGGVTTISSTDLLAQAQLYSAMAGMQPLMVSVLVHTVYLKWL